MVKTSRQNRDGNGKPSGQQEELRRVLAEIARLAGSVAGEGGGPGHVEGDLHNGSPEAEREYDLG